MIFLYVSLIITVLFIVIDFIETYIWYIYTKTEKPFKTTFIDSYVLYIVSFVPIVNILGLLLLISRIIGRKDIFKTMFKERK